MQDIQSASKNELLEKWSWSHSNTQPPEHIADIRAQLTLEALRAAAVGAGRMEEDLTIEGFKYLDSLSLEDANAAVAGAVARKGELSSIQQTFDDASILLAVGKLKNVPIDLRKSLVQAPLVSNSERLNAEDANKPAYHESFVL